jgi:RNA polymerase sigma-70 factor, ECF subfamily
MDMALNFKTGIIKMSKKDKLLFEDLALKHMDNLYSKAIRLAKNTKNAEDLVQLTFKTACEQFEKFDKNSDFEKWLNRILMLILVRDGFMIQQQKEM